MCLGQSFYMLCLGLVAALGAFILFIVLGANHRAQCIYFMCHAWGSSRHVGHLFYVPHLELIIALGAFILCTALGAYRCTQGI